MTKSSGSSKVAVAPLERMASNPIVTPQQVPFTRATGAFNPGAAIDRASGRVVLLVRVFEEKTRRSCLALALSSDGERIDEIRSQPAVARVEPYEEWGVEDARITYLDAERRYAITYTGYSSAGPRVCLITTDDLLAPDRYRRHGPRIDGDNKNCVILPERVDGDYVILHRPMPRIVCARIRNLDDPWPTDGTPLVGPLAGSWRSSRVGAGAPPIRTEIGWLLPFHGATAIEDGNVYSMGWCVLDLNRPEIVKYVSDVPALGPRAPYEIEMRHIPQVDPANFKTGVRVVFPQGFVEHGEDFLVYYGAADVSVGGARVNKKALIDSLRTAIAGKQGGVPL
jgi:predicted GH43/DUF377 family glycosyl hydrolase